MSPAAASVEMEAVIDEVAVLEEALQQAVAQRRSAEDMRGYERRSPAGLSPDKAADTAVASYGMQLRAWVDLQVDARLGQMIPSLLEGDLAIIRAESSSAVEAVARSREKAESEVRAVAESQGKLLQVIEGMSRELARCKVDSDNGREALEAVMQVRNALDDLRQQDLASEVRRLKEHLSNIERQLGSEGNSARELSAWAERRFSSDGHRFQNLERQIADLEGRFSSRLEGFNPDLAEQVAMSSRSELESKLHGLRKDFEGQLESRISTLRELCGSSQSVEDFRSRMASQASQLEAMEQRLASELRTVRSACRDEMKSQLGEAKTSLSEDLVSLQQRLVAELRVETTAALNRESAAIATLDEQLWITDQRLGQRIDELAQAQLHVRGSKVSSSKIFNSLVSEDSGLATEPVTTGEGRHRTGASGLAAAEFATKSLLEASQEEAGDSPFSRRSFGRALSTLNENKEVRRSSRSNRLSVASDSKDEKSWAAQQNSESRKLGTRTGVLAMAARAAEAFAASADLDD